MDRADTKLLDALCLLLHDWVDKTATLVERSASDQDLRLESEWASQAAGEADWAFEWLADRLATEELNSALRVVLFWGMAGLLHSSLGTLDERSQLADRFTARLYGRGEAPFVTAGPEGTDD